MLNKLKILCRHYVSERYKIKNPLFPCNGPGVINSLPESMEGVVLYERYINLAKWDDIADLLMYSTSNIFRLHALGLNEVEAILNESNRDDV